MTIGCDTIIEQSNRIGQDIWGIPGGIMEPGEIFLETAVQETFEETGLIVDQLQLFGLYSGELLQKMEKVANIDSFPTITCLKNASFENRESR